MIKFVGRVAVSMVAMYAMLKLVKVSPYTVAFIAAVCVCILIFVAVDLAEGRGLE